MGLPEGTLQCVCQGSDGGPELTVQLSESHMPGPKGGSDKWVLGDGELQAGRCDFEIKMISSAEGKGFTWKAGEGWKMTEAVPWTEPTGGIV